MNFELLTPRVRERGVCRQKKCYHVATYCYSILFDMQDDHVLKKNEFDLLTPYRLGGGGGGLVGSVGTISATMLRHW